MTGDGSVSCIDSPNEQEGNTAPLHFSEVVCALGSLEKGGDVVVKMFTLFEHSSICIVYLLGCLFSKIIVCKPATSKSGNSETYLVGKGFNGVDPQLLETLLSNVGDLRIFENNALFPLDTLPSNFIKQVVACATLFADFQRQTIEENLALENQTRISHVRDRILNERRWVTDQWHHRFPNIYLRSEDKITKNDDLDGSFNHKGRSLAAGRSEQSSVSVAERKRKRNPNEKPSPNENIDQYEEKEAEEPPLKKLSTQSAVESMMKKMGYGGGGLGKDEQGQVDAVQNDQKLDRLGLGYQSKYLDWFDQEVHWINNKLPLDEKQFSLEFRHVIGKKVTQVKLSKFCDEKNIQPLHALRSSKSELLSNLKQYCKGPCHLLGKEELYVDRNSLKLLVLDQICKDDNRYLFPFLKRDQPFYFADFTNTKGGFIDYTLSQFGSSSTKCFVTRKLSIEKFSSKSWIDAHPTCITVIPISEPTSNDTFLTNVVDSVSTFIDKETQSQKLHLIFGDIKSSKPADSLLNMELLSQYQFVKTLILALSNLCSSGTFLCRIYDTWTRFSVGILYLLHKTFESISIIKPFTSCAYIGERFLVCNRFYGFTSELDQFCRTLYHTMTTLQHSNQNVLQLVSPSYLNNLGQNHTNK